MLDAAAKERDKSSIILGSVATAVAAAIAAATCGFEVSLTD